MSGHNTDGCLIPHCLPRCLVCNGHLGSSARGSVKVFSGEVTSHRGVQLHDILGQIVMQTLTQDDSHSLIICKRCFRLIDDIDLAEEQLEELRKVVKDKYLRTILQVRAEAKALEPLIEVTEGGLTVSDCFTQCVVEEESSAIDELVDQNDMEYKGYMSSAKQNLSPKKRGRRRKKRGRPRKSSPVVWSESDGSTMIKKNRIKKETEEFETAETESALDIQMNNSMETNCAEVDDFICETSAKMPDVVTEVDGLDLEDYGSCADDLGILPIESGPDKTEQSNRILSKHEIDETNIHYKCRFCGYQTKIFLDVAEHMKELHQERLYECEICEQRLASRLELLTHLDHHVSTGEEQYPCHLCPCKWALPRDLRDHLREHAQSQQLVGRSNFECKDCGKRFRLKETLAVHVNKHTGSRPFECPQCPKRFPSKPALAAHSKTHNEMRPRMHQCAVCAKRFLSSHHLAEHALCHNPHKEHVCAECGKAFATTRALGLHMIIHSGVRNYECVVCSHTFARRNELEDHRRVHTGERPFQCEICGATFTQRSNLQTHKRNTHYQERRYECLQCNKTFKRNRLLVYHTMSAHTGERPHKCAHCDASFVYPEHYKKHIRIHTGEKPFLCDVCGKSFNSRDNRNAHKFVHTDKRPYECVLCAAGFMRKPHAVTHMAQHEGHMAQLGLEGDMNKYIRVNNAADLLTDLSDGTGDTGGGDGLSHAFMDTEDGAGVEMEDETIRVVRHNRDTLELLSGGHSGPVAIIEANDLPHYLLQATPPKDSLTLDGDHMLLSSSFGRGHVVEIHSDDLHCLEASQVSRQVSQIITYRTQPGSLSAPDDQVIMEDVRDCGESINPDTHSEVRQIQVSTGLPSLSTSNVIVSNYSNDHNVYHRPHTVTTREGVIAVNMTATTERMQDWQC